MAVLAWRIGVTLALLGLVALYLFNTRPKDLHPDLEVSPLPPGATDAEGAAVMLATELRELRKDRGPTRWLAIALLFVTLVVVGLLVATIIIIQPILRTATTVQEAAGPGARAAQQAQTEALLRLFLCTQRETNSEGRVMNGQEPLPLRDGCPAYRFGARVPIIPPGFGAPTTTTTTAPPRKQATTSTHVPATSAQPTTVVTTTTAAMSDPCTAPTLPVLGTCLTVPEVKP